MGLIQSTFKKDLIKICRRLDCVKILDNNDQNIYCSYCRLTMRKQSNNYFQFNY